MRILIAEDDTDILELLTLYLENNSYKIILAKNGLEALECFKQSSENYFDAVLMDVMMSVMGMSLLKKLEVKVKFLLL